MVRRSTNRLAFTLIELIFAIVVIAISVMSLPMMSAVTSKGIENNLIQEAIFGAAAGINEATTYPWDEYSLTDVGLSALARVINMPANDCTVAGNRPGNINRECLVDLTASPYSSNAGVTYNLNSYSLDSNAYGHTSLPFTTNSSSSTYKQDYLSTLNVNLCSSGTCTTFGTIANNPNLKELEFFVEDKDGNTLVLLRAYCANIGELKPIEIDL